MQKKDMYTSGSEKIKTLFLYILAFRMTVSLKLQLISKDCIGSLKVDIQAYSSWATNLTKVALLVRDRHLFLYPFNVDYIFLFKMLTSFVFLTFTFLKK